LIIKPISLRIFTYFNTVLPEVLSAFDFDEVSKGGLHFDQNVMIILETITKLRSIGQYATFDIAIYQNAYSTSRLFGIKKKKYIYLIP
jgi:acetate kinase